MANSSIVTLAEEILKAGKQSTKANNDAINQSLIEKANALIFAVQSPMDHAATVLIVMLQPVAVRMLMQCGIFQAIPAPPQSIRVDELERQTNAQASLIARLLRVVAGSGLITFKHDNSGAITYYDCHDFKEPDGDDSAMRNPTTWHHGCEGSKTAFDIVQSDPKRLQNFHILMQMAEHFRPWTGFYDYGKLADGAGERPVFVDIGGGNGTMIAKILEAQPNISPKQCILLDREEVVQLARTRQQDGTLPSGVQCQVHDFFTPQPVQGAKAYHLRAITHNWSDSVVTKILANIVPAMAKDSKVLIADNVVPSEGAKGMTAMMDMVMLSIGGKERTKADFAHALEAAGLKIAEVNFAEGGDQGAFAVVEAVLK